VSALGYGGIIGLGQYIFASQYVFTAKMFPQLWRIFTAFLITKPKFAILLDPYFLYQYGSAIERESSRFSQPGDFFTYTMFVGSLIVVSFPFGSRDCTYTNTRRIDTSVCDSDHGQPPLTSARTAIR
jgi:membrane associated rhomboid family serine protease